MIMTSVLCHYLNISLNSSHTSATLKQIFFKTLMMLFQAGNSRWAALKLQSAVCVSLRAIIIAQPWLTIER